jgi:hypothetical protein
VARAMVLFERRRDGSWMPDSVILATPKRLRGKCLPGSPDREARLAMLLRDARPPRLNDFTEERGTYLNWVDWALNALANGHTTWTAEVEPTRTVDELFQREVLNVVRMEAPAEPSPVESRDQAPEVEPSHEYYVEASERDDDLLRRYLPDERPSGFDTLPADERAWRGRYLLMTWAFTGSLPFAWAAASVRDPEQVDANKKVVAGVPDLRIEAELERTAAERGRHNVIFTTLGEPVV